MSENNSATDIGARELISGLITSVFDSVLAAQHDQEQKLAEIEAALKLDERDFAESYVGDLEVQAQLREWFPSQDKPDGLTLDVGAQVAIAGPAGQLALTDAHGVSLWRLEDEHLQPAKDRSQTARELTQAGVDFLHTCARLRMGERQRASLRLARERGMPRVVIDSGRIGAKLSFTVAQESPEAEVPAVRAAMPVTSRVGPLRRGTGVPQSSTEPAPVGTPTAVRSGPVRLLVRSPSSRAESDSQLSFDGEFELHFRTVL